MRISSLLAAALVAGHLAPSSCLALDACLFQPLYREVGFEQGTPGASIDGMVSPHYGWGTVSFTTNAEVVIPPMYYLGDAVVRGPSDTSVRLLISGAHVVGPILPEFELTVTFPRDVTEASFAFGAPLLSRSAIVARAVPLNADGFQIGPEVMATTSQTAGSYPGGGAPIPVTREGTLTVSGQPFAGLKITFEPVGGYFPGFEDPTTETPRDFRFDNVRWTPVTYCCAADYDGDGGVGVGDIFSFLTAWFENNRAADPRADFNVSGVIDLGDLFQFLNAWFVGCG